MPEAHADSNTYEIQIRVETWRMTTYFFFWLFVIVAIAITNTVVVDELALGALDSVPLEQQGCGAFNRNGGKFNLTYGEGFDFKTQNHLVEYFGFGNICSYWDYSPAREIVAAIFPLFEYSLMIYLTLDIINTRISYQRGLIPGWFWKCSLVLYFITVFMCTMFRLIFVNIASESLSWHTMGFLCLQIGLVLIAATNTMYVIMSGQTYPTIGLHNPRKIALVAKIYLGLLLFVSYLKIEGSIYIVLYGVSSPFYLRESGIDGLLMGQLIDKGWMLLNAAIPMFIAWVRAHDETPLKIQFSSTVDSESDYTSDPAETPGENSRLNP